MECSKWQETGLLYTSGELTPDEMSLYKEHIAACEGCAGELRQYTEQRKRFFSAELLGEISPQFVDETILTFASRSNASGRPAPVTPTSLGIFSLIFKRQSVGMLVLLLGIIAGFGIMVNYQKQSGSTPVATFKAPAAGSVLPAPVTAQAMQPGTMQKDSADTSNKVPFSKRVGNISHQGVIPVDLHKP
jgi:anti-sigma factor RsiW